MNITTNLRHVLHKCSRESCSICEGGLALCTVCGGAEASLPTECPGVRMTQHQQDQVQSGEIDFLEGRWTHPSEIWR
jgi:hypothetical protein